MNISLYVQLNSAMFKEHGLLWMMEGVWNWDMCNLRGLR